MTRSRYPRFFWPVLVIFSLVGQIAWVVENMYFNVFIYKMFGASSLDISTMVAASAVAATLTTVLIGAVSDRIGKRKLIICIGYILWGFSILSFSLIRVDLLSQFVPLAQAASLGVSLVIIMDCVMTFFGSSANDACFNAWLTDSTDEGNRGAAEGINAMMPMLAILVVFGGFMAFDLNKSESWTAIFTIIGAAVIVIGVLGFFLIRENGTVAQKDGTVLGNILYGFRPSVIKANPILYITLLAFAVFGISIQIFMPYLIIYYEVSLKMENYVLIMAPAIILAAIFTAFYGKLYDKKGFKTTVLLAVALLISGYALLYLFRATLPVFLGSLLMMCGYLSGCAVFGAMIRDYTPEGKAGRFQGLRIFGQVLIPGIIGPYIGAAVLRNAEQVLGNDGTYSFKPNQNIFLAAGVVAVVLLFTLLPEFSMLRRRNAPPLKNMLTPEGEALGDSQPHGFYPRPQLKRDSFLCLNGRWDFSVTDGEEPTEYKEKITVPFPPQSMLSGIGRRFKKGDVLHYRRTFTLPDGFARDCVILHIGATDQRAEVYLNGELLCENEGGYLPFSADMTDLLREENTLYIKVFDNPLDTLLPYGKQREKRGGMWYTPISGIWQTVWVESVPKDFVRSLKIDADDRRAVIKIDGAQSGTLILHTEEGDNEIPFSDSVAEICPESPKLWSPESPYLYRFTIEADEDKVESYFALRKLETKEIGGVPRLCLNGKPYFFNGLLDQGYYSDGIYTPASAESYTRDILSMKLLGFNTLRKHIKLEPEIFYYECDRLGMVVFQDMVNNGHYSFMRDTALPTVGFKRLPCNLFHLGRRQREIFAREMEKTVAALYNHPSVCLWTIFNEGWGQFETDRMYDSLCALDQSRFIDSASGWFRPKKSDVISEHVYFKPVKLKVGKKPLFLSEFGGYTYKCEGHSFNEQDTYGYRHFSDPDAFAEAVIKLYESEIIPAAKEGLCAAIYSQLSDVEDEVNGIVSYDRKVLKLTPEQMTPIAKALEEAVK